MGGGREVIKLIDSLTLLTSVTFWILRPFSQALAALLTADTEDTQMNLSQNSVRIPSII